MRIAAVARALTLFAPPFLIENADANRDNGPLDVLDVAAGVLGTSIATVHEVLIDRWMRTRFYDELVRER